MGCSCRSGRRAVSYVAEAPEPSPEQSTLSTPHRLTRPDGSTQDFPTKLAAYTTRLLEGGGGEISPIPSV